MVHKSCGRDCGRCGAFTTAVVRKAITSTELQQTTYHYYCCSTVEQYSLLYFTADCLILLPVLTLRPCAQQHCPLCAESVSPAQYVPSPVCRDGRDGAALVSPFGRPYAKHTRTELPSTRLPCSSFPHAPLGPDLPVHFSKQFAAAHGVIYIFFFVSSLRPMGDTLIKQLPREKAQVSCDYSTAVEF